jgi:hypothetical protein
MTSREIYKRFLLKINKNDTNAGINIPVSHFVLLFNSERLFWLGEELKEDADNVRINRLKSLLISDKELVKIETLKDSVLFKLPDQFYRHAFSYSVVSSDTCPETIVYNFEKIPLNFIVNLADDYNRPQFDYRETPFILTEDKYKVYFDNFEIKKVFLNYYKEPDEIDIEGYIKIDGTPSKNKETDLDEDDIESILNRMSAEVIRQYQDANSINFAKDRIQSEP